VNNYTKFLKRLLHSEGGYVWDKNDPGGETKYGISKRSYPDVDIKNLTIEKAGEIYKKDFWDPLNADKLYDGVAFQLFDFAVNSGISTAIRAYQRALGVADDGHFGPVSLQKSKEMSESDQIMGILAERLEFMSKLRAWQHFSRGWAKRIADNLRYGMEDSE
jgi:lysozyme family protein